MRPSRVCDIQNQNTLFYDHTDQGVREDKNEIFQQKHPRPNSLRHPPHGGRLLLKDSNLITP